MRDESEEGEPLGHPLITPMGRTWGGILPHNSIPHSLPGATPEALPAEDNACVICREEMGPEVTALPCCHVFHTRFGAKQAVLGSLLGLLGREGLWILSVSPP